MNVIIKLKKRAVVLLGIMGATAVILFSDTLKSGIKPMLSLCLNSVIPSLFLFTAMSLFISKSYIGEMPGRLLSRIFKPVLGLTAAESTVFLLSCIGGYPVGAKLLDSMYLDGKTDRNKALKMLAFSVNAGPAFIITAVGSGILHSKDDGVRLLAIHLLSTLILAIIVRFLPNFKTKKPPKTKRLATENGDEPNLIDLFVLSVADAGQTIINICIFVVFFGAIGFALTQSDFTFFFNLGATIEVTSGLCVYTRSDLPIISFLLGFGGISVIFQVLSSSKSLRPPIWLIIMSRLIHGAVAALLTVLAEVLFPRSLSTGVFNTQPQTPEFYNTPLAGLSLIFLFIVLVCFCRSVLSAVRHR